MGGGVGGDYAGLSNVRGTAVRTTGKGGSVKVGALSTRGVDRYGNPLTASGTFFKHGRTRTANPFGTVQGRNITRNGVTSFQVSSGITRTAAQQSKLNRNRRGD